MDFGRQDRQRLEIRAQCLEQELIMDLNGLSKTYLVLLRQELGGETRRARRKPHIIDAILAIGADDSELTECWELVKEWENRKEEEKKQELELKSCERELELKRQELDIKDREPELETKRREQELELKRRDQELELKRLEVELKKAKANKANSANQQPLGGGNSGNTKMKDLMPPFTLGEDIGLFLVNYERTCEKKGFERNS